MLWNWIIDNIPWWVYLLGAGLGIAIVTYIFGPILLPIWNRLPSWLKWTLSAIGVGFLVWIAGRNTGRRNANREQEQREVHAVQTRKVIHDETKDLDTPALDRRIDRWMRDK